MFNLDRCVSRLRTARARLDLEIAQERREAERRERERSDTVCADNKEESRRQQDEIEAACTAFEAESTPWLDELDLGRMALMMAFCNVLPEPTTHATRYRRS